MLERELWILQVPAEVTIKRVPNIALGKPPLAVHPLKLIEIFSSENYAKRP